MDKKSSKLHRQLKFSTLGFIGLKINQNNFLKNPLNSKKYFPN